MLRRSMTWAGDAGITRRAAISSLASLALLLVASPDRAEDVVVPVGVQAELLVKVAAYDRNLPGRAGDRVVVVIVTKPGDADSARVGAAMQKALSGQPTIAGLPHVESLASYEGAPALAKLCRDKRAGILYLAPGFTDDEIGAMAKALDGVDVLSTAAMPAFVPKGIVLGFDLVSGKPRLLVHLAQAKRQRVALSAEVLKLMKVYE
jgi:hypothetical protein